MNHSLTRRLSVVTCISSAIGYQVAKQLFCIRINAQPERLR
ncbi:MAG: hypothetical protein V7K47_12480 [Nostoc sp.]